MNIDLTGKVVVVTGASSGIGAEISRMMSGAGALVVAVGRDEAKLDQIAATADGLPGEIRTVAADLSDPSTHTKVLNAVSENGSGVDALVLAAGHFINTPFADTPIEQFDQLWAVHVRAPFLLIQALLPDLNEGSSILFFSSTVARAGFAPYLTYTAVKGAIEAMSRSLAIELSPSVRVNTIVPGFTGTPMVTDQFKATPGLEEAIVEKTPVGFLGGPESAAGLATLLVSNLGSYVDGASFVVDGGWSAQGWQP